MKYEEDERGYQCGDEDKLGPALSQGYPPVHGATDERNQTQHLQQSKHIPCIRQYKHIRVLIQQKRFLMDVNFA